VRIRASTVLDIESTPVLDDAEIRAIGREIDAKPAYLCDAGALTDGQNQWAPAVLAWKTAELRGWQP
jgi:hypothetical protein